MYPVADERPACREERQQLKQVQARQEYCREKVQRVKHWKQHIHHELFEFQGRIAALKQMLETELPLARVRLQHAVRRLDEYQLERPPTAGPTEEKMPPQHEEQQGVVEE